MNYMRGVCSLVNELYPLSSIVQDVLSLLVRRQPSIVRTIEFIPFGHTREDWQMCFQAMC
jgi:hypothetical protein